MTVQDIFDELDDHGFDDTSETRKLAFLNSVYLRICSKELWPFLEDEDTAGTVTAGTTAISMPADWAKTKKLSIYDPVIGQSDTSPLRFERFDWLRDTFWDLETTASQSRPLYYYFKGNAINVYPVPDRDFTVVHNYFKTPTKLAASDQEEAILIPPRYHESILVPGTLVKLYAMEDDTELAAEFKADFAEAYFDMRTDLLGFQVDRPEHIYYTDIDEYSY